MSPRRLSKRPTLELLVERVDARRPGELGGDTVPSGFPSLDRLLGGGFRRRDLAVLGGDVGAGKSALALAVALRVANAGRRVLFASGEMSEERLLERALAIEGKVTVDELRSGAVSDATRATMGAAAVRLRHLPITWLALERLDLDALAARAAEPPRAALLVVDYLQILPPPPGRPTQDEEAAATLRRLKSIALAADVAVLVTAQLPRFDPLRANPRPTLDDFGHLGAVKQHADLVLALFREEMYHPGGGVEGATELIVAKNRNGPTGFVDLYFYRRWMRFEDMLDPDR